MEDFNPRPLVDWGHPALLDYEPSSRCRNYKQAKQGRGICRNACHCVDVVLERLATELCGERVVTPLRPTYVDYDEAFGRARPTKHSASIDYYTDAETSNR